MLQRYYEQYLEKTLHVSMRSVSHYISAIRVISALLTKNGHELNDLFNIQTVKQIGDVELFLETLPEYFQKNRTGNHMYSVALHHYRHFIEFAELNARPELIEMLDTAMPKPKTHVEKKKNSWTRNEILKEQVIIAAGRRCEIDNSHTTFISRATGFTYMEGHHIIPMRFQDQFAYSLDIYANIICVCPNCHRFLHHGIGIDKIDVVKRIFDERHQRFDKSGINISLESLLSITTD